MTRRPTMQFYVADWLGGTSLMSCAARGAFVNMLCVSWEQGPLPNTRGSLFKAMGLGPDDPPFDQLWSEVQSKWTLTDDGWVNAKLERVREARDRYTESQAAKGRKGGRPPKAGEKPELPVDKAGAFEKPAVGGKPEESSPSSPPPTTATPTPISDENGTSGRQRTGATSVVDFPAAVRRAPDSVDEVVRLWNETRSPGPKVDKLTPKRRAAIAKCLREYPDLTLWRDAITWVNGQRWCNAPGGSGDHANWRLDFDYLIRPGKLAKTIERMRTDGAVTAANGGLIGRDARSGRTGVRPGMFAGLEDA